MFSKVDQLVFLFVGIISHLVMSNSFWPHGLFPTRLLSPWDSPGKNTGVDSHSLFWGTFPTQGLNLGLLHCRQILYCLSQQGSHPILLIMAPKMKRRSIKPKVAWPIIDKWPTGFGISDRELSSLSNAAQRGFTETLLHSSWFLLGPRGLPRWAEVFPVLGELTLWQEGMRDSRDSGGKVCQSLSSAHSGAQRRKEGRASCPGPLGASLRCHHPSRTPAPAKTWGPAVPLLLRRRPSFRPAHWRPAEQSLPQLGV